MLLNRQQFESSSGFEICLLESGDDIAFFANVSFDSEGRSAIDVKSRFAAKWSPTIRHIGIGIVIDRAFTLEITVNSSEFVVSLIVLLNTYFILKRCNAIRTAQLMNGGERLKRKRINELKNPEIGV